jgi:hypothetical protein
VREADVELQLLDEIITGYRRAVGITQNRYQAGVAAHTDLLQAQSTLENAGRPCRAAEASRDTTEQAIALLIGQPPARFALAPAPWQAACRPCRWTCPPSCCCAAPTWRPASARWPPPTPASAPRAWLRHQPQPLGGPGRQAGSWPRWPRRPLAWSLGAALVQTLFDAGARRRGGAGARRASGGHGQLPQSVLTALGQVENQLTAMAALAKQIEHAHGRAGRARRRAAHPEQLPGGAVGLHRRGHRAGQRPGRAPRAAAAAARASRRRWG